MVYNIISVILLNLGLQIISGVDVGRKQNIHVDRKQNIHVDRKENITRVSKTGKPIRIECLQNKDCLESENCNVRLKS